MTLLEQEAQRMAQALDEYEDVSVIDIGGIDPDDYWLVVSDGFDQRCVISSQLDYWNLLTAVVRSVPAANSAVNSQRVAS